MVVVPPSDVPICWFAQFLFIIVVVVDIVSVPWPEHVSEHLSQGAPPAMFSHGPTELEDVEVWFDGTTTLYPETKLGLGDVELPVTVSDVVAVPVVTVTVLE